MGLYDSLVVDCPKCGKQLEFQSKSGPCYMHTCKKNNLTPDIAVGMNGEIVRCQFCNKRIKLECNIPTNVKVKLIITRSRKFDYDGNYNENHPHSKRKAKELHSLFTGKVKA